MRIVTITSDGMYPVILQQSQWSGYEKSFLFHQLIADLKVFIQTVESKLIKEQSLNPLTPDTSTEQINNFLDKFNNSKKLPEEPLS